MAGWHGGVAGIVTHRVSRWIVWSNNSCLTTLGLFFHSPEHCFGIVIVSRLHGCWREGGLKNKHVIIIHVVTC